MKVPTQKLPEGEFRTRYPIAGTTLGWRFRATETSSSVWRVDGSDRFGRQVSRQGTDVDRLQEQCEADARDINRALEQKNGGAPD